MATKNIYSRVRGLLEPGEIDHLEQVAEWLGRPHYAVIVDEVRRQYGRYEVDGQYKVNKSTSLDSIVHEDGTPVVFEDPSVPVIDTMITTEKMDYLSSKIDSLPEDERKVLRASLLGISYRTIAKDYRLPLTQVDNLLRRAKKNLADILIPSYFLS